MTYTAFCQESSGSGTIWISAVEAMDEFSAVAVAQIQCAADWDQDLETVHVLGIAEGDVNILLWNDIDS